jgi:hypothetical protein
MDIKQIIQVLEHLLSLVQDDIEFIVLKRLYNRTIEQFILSKIPHE